MFDINKINEIEERMNNATEGKWIAHSIPYNGFDDSVVCTEEGIFIAATTYDMQSITQNHKIEADTIFIANAKEDISYLIKTLKILLKDN